MPTQPDFERRIAQIDQLVGTLEQAGDPASRAAARELLQTMMDLYGSGLERTLEVLHECGASGDGLIDQLGRDPLVSSLMLLHGLHPVPLETRVMAGLEKARPYLKSHKGNVELVGIDPDGSVHLRLAGSCHGCPSSAMTLKLAIEEAIREAAPDVTAIVVEGDDAAGRLPGLVVLESATSPAGTGRDEVVWEAVAGLDRLEPGEAARFTVLERSLVGCRVDGALYAYGDRCPACGEQLEVGALEGEHISCAGCGERFDVVRAGRSATSADRHLDPFPLLTERGMSRVALPPLGLQLDPA